MSEAGRVFLSHFLSIGMSSLQDGNLAVKPRGEGKGSPNLALDSRPSLASVLGRPDFFLRFRYPKGFFRTFARLRAFCINTLAQASLHSCLSLSASPSLLMPMFVCTHIHMYVYIYMYLCIHVCVYVYVSTYMYMYKKI